MDADGVGPVEGAPDGEAEVAAEVFAGHVFACEFLDDAFAAGADEDAALAGERGKVSEELKIFFARGAEANHGVEVEGDRPGAFCVGFLNEGKAGRGENEFDVFAARGEDGANHFGDGFGVDAVDDGGAVGDGLCRGFGMVGID